MFTYPSVMGTALSPAGGGKGVALLNLQINLFNQTHKSSLLQFFDNLPEI